MKFKKMYQSYKAGYDLAKKIDEFVDLYGRENFVNRTAGDKETLEDISHQLGTMYAGAERLKSFFMFWGFHEYQNKTAWKRLKKRIKERRLENEKNEKHKG